MFVDTTQPVTRLELITAYSRLNCWLLEQANLFRHPVDFRTLRLSDEEALAIAGHLDPDCLLFEEAVNLLIDLQRRYDLVEPAMQSERAMSVGARDVAKKMLVMLCLFVATQLERLFKLAKEARDRSLYGDEFVSFWRDASRKAVAK